MTLSKKFKQSKKSVAAFLIFAMAISFLPAGMFSGFSREASDKEAYVLGEDVEKRKADEKHFIMSDGTMMAVKYSEQVHYQADAGKWVEIDNSLSYDTKLKKFTNKNNPTFTVDFPEDGRVSVSSEKGYTLSFSTSVIKGTKNVNISSSYDKMVASAPTATKKAVKYESNRESFDVPGVRSALEYRGAYGNDTNVKYSVSQNIVKEDIIIDSDVGITSFVTEYYTALSAAKQPDGSIYFIDKKGDIIFKIGSPYMYDSKYSECPAIDVSVQQTTDGWCITYTPDSTWMKSGDRVYPMTFDPSVSSLTGSYNSTSEMILTGYERRQTSVVETNTLKIGYEYYPQESSAANRYRYYRVYYKPLKYPEIDLAFNNIESINLTLKTQAASGYGTMKVYKLASGDSQTAINYNSSNTLIKSISYNSSTAFVELPVDISEYVSYYNSGYNSTSTSNITYGYMITENETANGTGGTSSGDNCNIRFYDTTQALASRRPTIYVKYVAKNLDGRYVFIEQNNNVMCLNDSATGISLVTKSGTNVNNPADLTNPVKSMWKLTLSDGVYFISPADDLTKYLTVSSSGTLTLSTSTTTAAQWNISVNSTTGKMTFNNVQYSMPLIMAGGNAIVDVGLNYSSVNSNWTVTDAYSIKGAISDKREYILYNPAIGKSLQFTNGTTNSVLFGEFNARTETLNGTWNEGGQYYSNCTVENMSVIQRIQLVSASSGGYYIKPFINGAYSNKYLSLSNGNLVVSSTATVWQITVNANGTYSVSNGSYKLGSNLLGTTPVASSTAANTQWNLDCIGLLVPKMAQKDWYLCGSTVTAMILKYHGWNVDYNHDGIYDEYDAISYKGNDEGYLSSYINSAILINELCSVSEEPLYGYCGYESNIMPETIKLSEYLTTISTSMTHSCPIYTSIKNPGKSQSASADFVMQVGKNDDGEYPGHAVVLKGICYNYDGSYNVVISDSNYRYIDINATGDGYNNGVGFDNVLNASNLLNYSITYDGSIIQIAGSKEAIFDYGYTEDDI